MEREYTEVEKDLIHKATVKAMKLIEFMDRTEYQLRTKLEEGEFPPFAVEEAVSYVKSFHYIDDARYAERFTESRKCEKSIFELKQEMKKRGIASDLIEAAILNTEINEEETVKNLFLKKYAKKALSDPKTYEKAFRYFGGKGYSYQNVKTGIENAVSSLNEES